MRCGDLLSTSEKLEGCLGQVNTHTATCVSCCCAWVDPQMLTPKSVWGGYLIIEPPPHMFSSAEQKSPPFNTGWFESHLPCQKSLLVFLPGVCQSCTVYLRHRHSMTDVEPWLERWWVLVFLVVLDTSTEPLCCHTSHAINGCPWVPICLYLEGFIFYLT